MLAGEPICSSPHQGGSDPTICRKVTQMRDHVAKGQVLTIGIKAGSCPAETGVSKENCIAFFIFWCDIILARLSKKGTRKQEQVVEKGIAKAV
jgi:hypothetical protein